MLQIVAHMKKEKKMLASISWYIGNYLLARANLIWHHVRWLGNARR